eukprot:TRINITY_DN9435_c1_g2_i1.p1 TRINITY_DN9435_c1_g2~~TRINITY_DN9435_c1_g2_i1.p1  ORF type:complete len:367 (-),score=69.83 TRINITY_DN9435_c1_g2_i1:238-1275(-)
MGNVMAARPLKEAPQVQWFDELREGLPRMDGKTVAITGCTSGMGLILAQTCGELGARVVMLNRPSARAEAALQGLQDKGISAALVHCDLCNLDQVRQAGERLRADYADGIDVLCNNAGLMGLPDEATVDGFDVQMQANHIAHFVLTAAVWPLLEAAAAKRGEARVVNHSSGARNNPKKPMSAEYLQKNGGKLGGDRWPGLQKWQRYQQGKLANLLFTYALHDQAQQTGSKVKSLCAHPGPTVTGLQEKTTAAGGTSMLDNFILNRVYNNCHATEDGAMGIVRCCCEEGVQSGQFYGPAQPGQPGPAELLPEERNEAGEKLLWEESVRSTGADFLFPLPAVDNSQL